MAFGRVLRVKVGQFELGNERNDGFLDLADLDLEFDITRSIRFWENGAQIKIYNASPETIKYLMGDASAVVVEAGHADTKVGVIYSGQIGMVRTERQGPDIITVISCVSSRGAYYQLAKLSCDVTFQRKSTFREALNKLCTWAGIALRGAKSELLDTELGRPFVFSGSFNDCISSFSLRLGELGYNTYLDNNELIIVGRGEGGKWNAMGMEKIELNYKNGLISAVEIRDENYNEIQGGGDPFYMLTGSEQGEALIKKYNIKEPAKAAVNVDRLRRLNFKSIISPIFAPNIFVDIDSRTGSEYDSVLAITGRFLILETNFKGDNMGGDFSATCEAVEVVD